MPREDDDTMRQSGRIVTALALSLLLLQPLCWAGEATEQQKEALKRYFTGKRITPKIDLPVLDALWVIWNGTYDRENYLKMLKNAPPSVLRGQTAIIRSVEVKEDHVVLNVNRGGSILDFEYRGASPERLFELGCRIQVHFGRKLTEADVQSVKILNALAEVAQIEGEQMPDTTAAARPEEVFAVTPEADSTAGAYEVPAVSEDPKVEFLGADANPAQVSPAESMRIAAHAEVAGIGSGDKIPVEIRFQLFKDGKALLSTPRLLNEEWGSGRNSAFLDFTVPRSATAGPYMFSVTLKAAGREQTREVVFLIKN